MATSTQTKIFGRRIRHYRLLREMTLKDLGEKIGKSPAILSMIENGGRSPSLPTLESIAAALQVTTADLVIAEPPDARSEMEIRYEGLADGASAREFDLNLPRISRAIPDEFLEDYLKLESEARRLSDSRGADDIDSYDADVREVREEWQRAYNYSEDLEKRAHAALKQSGYDGAGNTSKRLLTALARKIGFKIYNIDDMPRMMHTVVDMASQRIYIGSGDFIRTTEARSVLAQNLAHLYLNHPPARTFVEKIRNRLEANYFAGALLMPEKSMAALMKDAANQGDLSIEDLRQVFFVSAEMAAHRFTNLAYQHLGVESHFIRTDSLGHISKSFAIDGLELPVHSLDPRRSSRVCTKWSASRVFRQARAFCPLYQISVGAGQGYFCISRIPDEPGLQKISITVGCRRKDGAIFRGYREAEEVEVGNSQPLCSIQPCCKRAPPEVVSSWENRCRFTARRAGDPLGTVTGHNVLTEDMHELYNFLEKQHKFPPR